MLDDSQGDNPTPTSGSESGNETNLYEGIRQEVSRDINAAFTKREQGLRKQIEDLANAFTNFKESYTAKEQEVEQVATKNDSLLDKLRENEQQIASFKRSMALKDLSQQITSNLANEKVQMVDIATDQILKNFEYSNDSFVYKDEYGQEVPVDKVVKSFLEKYPAFKPPRQVTGTATTGGAGNLPNTGHSGLHSDGSEQFRPENYTWDFFVKNKGLEWAQKNVPNLKK